MRGGEKLSPIVVAGRPNVLSGEVETEEPPDLEFLGWEGVSAQDRV